MILCLTDPLLGTLLWIACAPATEITESPLYGDPVDALSVRADCEAFVVIDLGDDGVEDGWRRESFDEAGRLVRSEDNTGTIEVVWTERSDGTVRMVEHLGSEGFTIYRQELTTGFVESTDFGSDGTIDLVVDAAVSGATESHVERDLVTGLVHWRTIERDEAGMLLFDIFDHAGDRTVNAITQYVRGDRLEEVLLDLNGDGPFEDVETYSWDCPD